MDLPRYEDLSYLQSFFNTNNQKKVPPKITANSCMLMKQTNHCK